MTETREQEIKTLLENAKSLQEPTIFKFVEQNVDAFIEIRTYLIDSYGEESAVVMLAMLSIFGGFLQSKRKYKLHMDEFLNYIEEMNKRIDAEATEVKND